MAVGEHLNAVAQPRGAHSRLGAVPKRALEVRAGRLYSVNRRNQTLLDIYRMHTLLIPLQETSGHAIGSRVLCVASFDSSQRTLCELSTSLLESLSARYCSWLDDCLRVNAADLAEIVEQKQLEPNSFSYYVHYVDCKQTKLLYWLHAVMYTLIQQDCWNNCCSHACRSCD